MVPVVNELSHVAGGLGSQLCRHRHLPTRPVGGTYSGGVFFTCLLFLSPGMRTYNWSHSGSCSDAPIPFLFCCPSVPIFAFLPPLPIFLFPVPIVVRLSRRMAERPKDRNQLRSFFGVADRALRVQTLPTTRAALASSTRSSIVPNCSHHPQCFPSPSMWTWCGRVGISRCIYVQ